MVHLEIDPALSILYSSLPTPQSRPLLLYSPRQPSTELLTVIRICLKHGFLSLRITTIITQPSSKTDSTATRLTPEHSLHVSLPILGEHDISTVTWQSPPPPHYATSSRGRRPSLLVLHNNIPSSNTIYEISCLDCMCPSKWNWQTYMPISGLTRCFNCKCSLRHGFSAARSDKLAYQYHR